MTRLVTVLFLFVLVPARPAPADAVQDLAAVRETVRAFVLGGSAPGTGTRTVRVGRLDPRLRLHPCPVPLQAFYPPGARRQGSTTVGVRCPGSRPWTLYVPVRIIVEARLLVAARSLPRGTILRPGDLSLTRQDISAAPFGYLTDPARAVGKRLKHPLPAGAVVTETVLENRPLVKRGQRVTLVAETAGLSVRMAGTALMDGGVGERIRVRNIRSRRIIEGTVVEQGLVRIHL